MEVHKVKIDIIKGQNKQFYNHSWRYLISSPQLMEKLHQKKSNDVDNLNSTINYLDLTDIYIRYTKQIQNVQPSNTHITYTEIDICCIIKQVSNVKVLK